MMIKRIPTCSKGNQQARSITATHKRGSWEVSCKWSDT